MPEYPAQQLTENLRCAETPADFYRTAEEALRYFDGLNEGIIAKSKIGLACRAGCSLCCSLRVDVFAHEVFLLAEHIRSHFSASELTALMTRLDAHAATILPLTPFEHATRNVPCAMLREGRCSVYAARPHSCRRHHSQDLAACQYTFDHPIDLETPAAHDRNLFRSLTEAMVQGVEVYAELGYDYTIYELGTALHEALTDPACWLRWRRREQAFLRASVTPAG
jgi:Fe-S-cluster containining protein